MNISMINILINFIIFTTFFLIINKCENINANKDHIYAFTPKKEPMEIYDVLENITRIQSTGSPKIVSFKTAMINNEIYLIGGYDNKNNDFLKTVYLFNPSNGKWSQTTSMNFERRVPGVAVNDGKIFVTGGQPSSDKFEFFNSNNKKWEILPEMLQRRIHHSSLYYKEHIYNFGGFTNDYTNTVEKYDINGRQWSNATSMISKRSNFAMALLNDKIYAVGGWNGSQILKTGEVYDHEKDSWSEIASMNEPRWSFALIAYNNKLYAIGGYQIKTVEIYDPTINEWKFMDVRKDIEIGEVVAALI